MSKLNEHQIVVRVSTETHDMFREVAWTKRSNMSEVLRDYIDEQIRLHEQKV